MAVYRSTITRRYTAILSATVREVGLGFKPTRRAEKEEGLFQMLCCDMGPRRMGVTVLKMILAMELRDPKLVDRMVTRCTIHLESPTDMQIDGEIFKGQEEIKLHIGPAIRFIRPGLGLFPRGRFGRFIRNRLIG